MTASAPPFAELVERARAVDIGEIIVQRGIKLRGRGYVFAGPCPRCGGRDRFAIHTAKQVFHCRGCGGRGYRAVSLVMFLDNSTFREAVEAISGERATSATTAANVQHVKHSQPADDDAERLRRADAIWRAAHPIVDTSAEHFLIMRGIKLLDVPDHAGLRFHPHCPWERGKQPCLLARFTHAVTGAPLGIHRRPLSIPGAKPRSLGPIAGGIVRLWPDDDVTEGLVIGEGIETTLAAATRIEHKGTLLAPAWACGSAGALEAFPVLPGVRSLTILSDHDANGRGQDAAARCAERWSEAGCEVTILTPRDVDVDFNDLIRWCS